MDIVKYIFNVTVNLFTVGISHKYQVKFSFNSEINVSMMTKLLGTDFRN